MRTTPEMIVSLKPDEVFVFGSNRGGLHGGGAARTAFDRFGAVWGEGRGHHGQSYAIDTMSGLDTLIQESGAFLDYAKAHPGLTFLVTPVGCGIAGHLPEQIAPSFRDAPKNVVLPQVFIALL